MPTPASDLTAILVPKAQTNENAIARLIAGGPYGDVWLRIKGLEAVGLWQVEIFDALGQMRVDPALVQVLSTGEGNAATFVHLNRANAQALVHAFRAGREVEGWLGAPEEIDERVMRYAGQTVDALIAADDKSRVHPQIAPSSTMALVRGRPLAVPTGLPIALGSFGFHDRAPSEADGEKEREDRVALVAFDAQALQTVWETMPGAELAARLHALPERLLGPMRGAREGVVAELAALGQRTPAAAGLRSVRALELAMLSQSYVFGGGDAVRFVDERLLPMFTLASGDPMLDEDEADALESQPSVLAAMVDALPYHSPQGSMLEQLDDDEVRPLAPWAEPGAEYVGSVFVLAPERLRPGLAALDQRDLGLRIDSFFRAWWKAMSDSPFGEDYQKWRADIETRGALDTERFLAQWAEWRVVLELAALNTLTPAMVFYG